MPPPRDVLVLTPSCTVSEVLSEMAQRSVISAPLLRDDGKDWLGFISVHDICAARSSRTCSPRSERLRRQHLEAPEWFLLDATPESAKRILSRVAERSAAFCDRTVGSIRRGPEGGDGAWMLADDASDPTLLDVIQKHFVPDPSNVGSSRHPSPLNHRVALYRYANSGPPGEGVVEVTDVFSLSDVTRYLARWEHIKRCLTPCTVADLGVGSTVVDTIPADSTVLRAFAMMSKLGVSGLGSHGTARERRSPEWPPRVEPIAARHVGSISESDLRRITPGHFDVLSMTVGEFISKLHAPVGSAPELADEPMAAARAHPLFSGMLTEGELAGGRLSVTCAPDATSDDVLKALARNRVHRVYAVEQDTGVAVRVVTHGDLVRFFALFAPTEEDERRDKTPSRDELIRDEIRGEIRDDVNELRLLLLGRPSSIETPASAEAAAASIASKSACSSGSGPPSSRPCVSTTTPSSAPSPPPKPRTPPPPISPSLPPPAIVSVTRASSLASAIASTGPAPLRPRLPVVLVLVVLVLVLVLAQQRPRVDALLLEDLGE